MKMFSPKVLLLDLGGVIFDVDYRATTLAFEELGMTQFDQLYSKAKQSELFDRFETGKISEAEFFSSVRDLSGMSLSDDQIRVAWNKMLIGIPSSRLTVLSLLKQKVPLFLLSNTNETHIKAFSEMLEACYGANPLMELFDDLFYSCRIGQRKPDAACFNLVIESTGIKREDFLFLDDSPQHVHGARQHGIPSYHLNLEGGENLETFLYREKFLIKP